MCTKMDVRQYSNARTDETLLDNKMGLFVKPHLIL